MDKVNKNNGIKEELEKYYNNLGIKRRFRKVKDGIWIFGLKNSPCGIFIDDIDFKENRDLVFSTIENSDDEIIHLKEKLANGNVIKLANGNVIKICKSKDKIRGLDTKRIKVII